jgi:HEAT repeat protein
MNLIRKYLSYIIFGLVVLGVVGLAVRHSSHLRSLVNAMASSDPQAQRTAAERLIQDEQFMDSITGEPTEVRVKAAEALEALGTDKAVKQAIALLKDQDKPVRDRAILTLKKIGAASPENIKELAGGLTEGDTYARKGMMAVFTDKDGIGPKPEVVTAIIEKMKERGEARTLGGDILSQPRFTQGGANAVSVPLLISYLKEKDEGVRSGAAEALGKIGDSRAVPPLIEALKDTPQVRRIAIGAIALIANPSGEAALTQAIKNPDDDNEARAQAAAGLGKIATPSAVRTLIETLNDDDLKLRSAAVAALARAGRPRNDAPPRPEALAAIIAALKDPRENTRRGAAQALQGIAAPEANPALIATLENRNNPTDLRAAAALALGFPGNQAAIAPLIRQLSDPDGTVNTAARDALGSVGPVATAALTAVMQKGGEEAYYAAQALARFGQAALPALQSLAQSPNPVGQRWAAVALGDLGLPEAQSALQQLEKSSDPDVAYVAQQQLSRLGRAQ